MTLYQRVNDEFGYCMKYTLLQDFAVHLARFGLGWGWGWVGVGVLATVNIHFHKMRQFFDYEFFTSSK